MRWQDSTGSTGSELEITEVERDGVHGLRFATGTTFAYPLVLSRGAVIQVSRMLTDWLRNRPDLPPVMHADDWYDVADGRRVATFAEGETPTGVDNPKELIGRVVTIDHERYKVEGVEHWAIPCEGFCNHPFALLVSKVAGL